MATWELLHKSVRQTTWRTPEGFQVTRTGRGGAIRYRVTHADLNNGKTFTSLADVTAWMDGE